MLSNVPRFLAVAAVILAVPGPSVLFIVGRALAHGRRTALASLVGNELGALVLALAVALGVGAVVQRSEVVFQAMKLGGAGYLVYLGIRAWRGRRSLVIAVPGGPRHDGWRGVREGFVVGVANPKAVIFFTAVLPQFVDQRAGHVTLQLIVLGGLFVLLAFVTDSLWGLAASQVRAWFARSPRRLAAVGGAGGLAMIAVGVSLAVTGRRE